LCTYVKINSPDFIHKSGYCLQYVYLLINFTVHIASTYVKFIPQFPCCRNEIFLGTQHLVLCLCVCLCVCVCVFVCVCVCVCLCVCTCTHDLENLCECVCMCHLENLCECVTIPMILLNMLSWRYRKLFRIEEWVIYIIGTYLYGENYVPYMEWQWKVGGSILPSLPGCYMHLCRWLNIE